MAFDLLVEGAHERGGVRGRDAQRVRQRPVVEGLASVEVQQDPVLARHPRRRLPHDGRGTVGDRLAGRAVELCVLVDTGRDLASEQLLARQREQPRLELLRSPQPVQLERRQHERVHHGVERVFGVAQNRCAEVVETVGVAVVDLREGASITRSRRRHELCIGQHRGASLEGRRDSARANGAVARNPG